MSIFFSLIYTFLVNRFITGCSTPPKCWVVKNHVEIVIPGVNINADDEDADAKAEAAVKKYLQENNLKKKKAAKFKLHVGLVNQKTVIQFKL